MGIGFAVSRFGLFLRQVSALESHVPARTTGLSLWSGVALVALGVIVTLSSVLRHIQLVRQLSSGTWQPGRVSRDAVILGLILAAIGIGMAIYLMLVPLKKMPVAKLTIELEIPHAQSLKDRRQVIRSMKDKLRHGFNLSVAELDDGIVWNRATLGIAAISSSTSYLTGQLQQIDQAVHRIAATLSAEVLDSYAEILPE